MAEFSSRTIANRIIEAAKTGHEAKFADSDSSTVYEFTPNGIQDWLNETSGDNWEYFYAVNSGNQVQSAAHQERTAFAENDLIFVKFYSVTLDPESGGWLKVITVRDTPYEGTVGTLANGGASGLLIEGLWHRFAVIPVAGGRIDIRRAGVLCTEGVTGWHTRLATILEYASEVYRITLTGSGVLSCTETVNLGRANWEGTNIRFQAGTLASSGTHAPTFFTAGINSTNTAVTVTQGTPVNVEHTGHGFSDNQQILLGVVPGGKINGSLSVLTTYYVKVVDANNYNLATTSGGAAINNAFAGVAGQVYAYYSTVGQALPSQSNIITQDIVRWDGKVERLGVVVRGAQNGSNRDHIKQDVTVWGDGNSSFQTPPSTLAIRHEADDSPNSIYNYSINYSAIGVGLIGPAEKHTLNVRGIYNRCSVYTLKDASADTLRVRLHNTDCQAHYYEHDGVDTSVVVDLDIESREDPADDAGSWGADAPAILVRNGKFTKIMGDMRGGNGLRTILVFGAINTLGTSSRVGADTVIFDVHMVQGSGIAFEARAVRHLSGRVAIRSWDDAAGVLAQNCPAVQIGRVIHGGGFLVEGFGISNYRGVQIGEADSGGYYSKQVNLGKYAINMGTLTQFTSAGAENSGASAHPTTLDAVVIEKWDDCVIDLTGTRGNVTLEAGCEGGVLQVDNLMKLFTITDDSSPATTIGLPTLSTTGLTIV